MALALKDVSNFIYLDIKITIYKYMEGKRQKDIKKLKNFIVLTRKISNSF